MFDEEADVVIKCGGGASDGGCGPSIDESCAWSVASWASIALVRQAKKRRRFAHSFEPIASSRGHCYPEAVGRSNRLKSARYGIKRLPPS